MSYFNELQTVTEKTSRSLKVIFEPTNSSLTRWRVTLANANGLHQAFGQTLEKSCQKLLDTIAGL